MKVSVLHHMGYFYYVPLTPNEMKTSTQRAPALIADEENTVLERALGAPPSVHSVTRASMEQIPLPLREHSAQFAGKESTMRSREALLRRPAQLAEKGNMAAPKGLHQLLRFV